MGKVEKLRGVVSLASNSIGSSTGYGVQGWMLAERMVKHGLNVANLSNYGLEGAVSDIQTKFGKVKHYPKGHSPYSDDVLLHWHEDFRSRFQGIPDAIVTLYDVWVYNKLPVTDTPIFAWTPADHVTMPPNVLKFLLRRNVTPVAMSPHGKRQFEAAGLECEYVPHAVDTKVMKPTAEVYGVPVREYLGVSDESFLVGIFGANKANGMVHRKAFAEQLLAFSMFRETHPDAVLYIHAEASAVFGGFNLGRLIKSVGLDDKSVIIANSDVLRTGYPAEVLAGFMSACDVVLAVSYGEGFGVPQVEAQACGTRVIGSSWAASPDLLSDDCWMVAGQPFWDEPQGAFFQVPLVDSIVEALKLAYAAPRGVSDVCVEFAKQFDVDVVWNWYWLPFLRKHFAVE